MQSVAQRRQCVRATPLLVDDRRAQRISTQPPVSPRLHVRLMEYLLYHVVPFKRRNATLIIPYVSNG